ncbi:hypothetical protein D9M71_526800 [compost metagenome]
MHLLLQAAFGLHDQPGAAQQRIGGDQAQAAEQREGREPVQGTAGIGAVHHRDAFDEGPQGHALEEGGGDGTADEGLVPQVALGRPGLEAELEGHAAEDQAQEHQDKRQVERGKHHRVGQREGAEQARAAEDQPGFVAVPHRRDGVHHHVALAVILDEGEEDADSEVETVHHHIHHHAEDDDHGPDQRKVDAHVQFLGRVAALSSSSMPSSVAESGRAGVRC